MSNWLSQTRLRFSNVNSLLHYSALGIIAGFCCALVVLLFRYSIEVFSALVLNISGHSGFSDLNNWLAFAIPAAGAILLGLVLSLFKSSNCSVGVPQVMIGIHAKHGHLPAKNGFVQFFAGIFALSTGQSGGQEGPAIHIGATVNSLLGRYLQLPNNSLRILVGCGTATAITVSFNTPLAGVIFAMEVVMMEYTVAGFTPILLATITGTALTHMFYGSEPLFNIPHLQLTSLWELPYIVLLGAISGSCAAAFLTLQRFCLRFNQSPILARLSIAGLVTGLLAIAAPEILGLSYETLNTALLTQITLSSLCIIILCKIVATAISCGLGMPIGLIGPSIMIGGCIGCAMGIAGNQLFPGSSSSQGFYALLGMGAMMGAVLNAPLAALLALLEFSNNPNIIFPGMLAIIAATLTNSEVFHQKAAHRNVLDALNLKLRTDPVSLALQRTSVASMMDCNILLIEADTTVKTLKTSLTESVNWLLVTKNKQRMGAVHVESFAAQLKNLENSDELTVGELEMAAHTLPKLGINATLREAFDIFSAQTVEAIYICDEDSVHSIHRGILTRSAVEQELGNR